MIILGRHKNLSFFAFTATPKATTLEMFGTEYADGSYHACDKKRPLNENAWYYPVSILGM